MFNDISKKRAKNFGANPLGGYSYILSIKKRRLASSQKKSNFLGSLHKTGFFCLGKFETEAQILAMRLAKRGCWRPCYSRKVLLFRSVLTTFNFYEKYEVNSNSDIFNLFSPLSIVRIPSLIIKKSVLFIFLFTVTEGSI